MYIWAIYLGVLIITIAGVEVFRRWSLKRQLLDIPNERSSHSVPTPRGGGLIICLVSMVSMVIYTIVTNSYLNWYYLLGAAIVALISLIDDVKNISPFVRIFLHALAAACAVWAFGGFSVLYVPFYGVVATGMWGSVMAFLWIVWLINAYNFMDGIDGIAAAQAITAGIGWSLAGYYWGIDYIYFYGGVLAATSGGFIIFNWQPAKIFMGDVGSAFLGYTFAVLPLLALRQHGNGGLEPFMPLIGIILVWFFVFDSVYTFFRRLIRRERVWQPHREHIYQKMVISGLPHAVVTSIYAALSAVLVAGLFYSLKRESASAGFILGTAGLETLLLLAIWRITSRKSDGYFI